MQASVTDQCVRLGFAIVLIVFVSIALYQFGGRTSASMPAAPVAGTVN